MRTTVTLTNVECDLCHKWENSVANIDTTGWVRLMISSPYTDNETDICEDCCELIYSAFVKQQNKKDEVPF